MESDRLPHKPPVRFVTEVLEHSPEHARFRCRFPEPPAIETLCEAASQGSAYVDTGDQFTAGMLTGIHQAVLHAPAATELLFDLRLRQFIGNFYRFRFTVMQDETAVAEGEISLFYT